MSSVNNNLLVVSVPQYRQEAANEIIMSRYYTVEHHFVDICNRLGSVVLERRVRVKRYLTFDVPEAITAAGKALIVFDAGLQHPKTIRDSGTLLSLHAKDFKMLSPLPLRTAEDAKKMIGILRQNPKPYVTQDLETIIRNALRGLTIAQVESLQVSKMKTGVLSSLRRCRHPLCLTACEILNRIVLKLYHIEKEVAVVEESMVRFEKMYCPDPLQIQRILRAYENAFNDYLKSFMK